MIALLIAFEAIERFFAPVSIHFNEAIPIAVVGLLVNIASAWLLSGGDHHGHGHSHGHAHGHGHEDEHDHHDEVKLISTSAGTFALSIFEDGVPPVFRLAAGTASLPLPTQVTVTTVRPDGSRQEFALLREGGYLESTSEIPEPHAFTAVVGLAGVEHAVEFKEHAHDDAHDAHHRDHNMRAAYIHVVADAAVSVLAIIGLLLAKTFGWLWMDPLAGVVGALVIANWSYGLIRDTGSILVDMNPDRRMAAKLRTLLEADGDRLVDLHLWRVGPGHLSVVVSVATDNPQRGPQFYHSLLQSFSSLSHITVEVQASPNR